MKIRLYNKNKPGTLDDIPDLTVDTLHLLNDIKLTHSMVLSAVYRIYDLHGLLTLVTSRHNVLLREVVKLKLDWDTVLPRELADRFKTRFKTLVRPGRMNPEDNLTKGQGTFAELHPEGDW